MVYYQQTRYSQQPGEKQSQTRLGMYGLLSREFGDSKEKKTENKGQHHTPSRMGIMQNSPQRLCVSYAVRSKASSSLYAWLVETQTIEGSR